MTWDIRKNNLVFSPFLALKNAFLGENFENSKNIPLDILEIFVVSKLDLVPMKIVGGSSSEQRTFQYPSIPI